MHPSPSHSAPAGSSGSISNFFFDIPVFPADRWPTQLFLKYFPTFSLLSLPNPTHLLSLPDSQVFSFLTLNSNKPFQPYLNFFIFKLIFFVCCCSGAAQAKNKVQILTLAKVSLLHQKFCTSNSQWRFIIKCKMPWPSAIVRVLMIFHMLNSFFLLFVPWYKHQLSAVRDSKAE